MKYYNTKEVAVILGLAVKTVQKLIRNGELEGYKIFGSYRVAHDTLLTFIEERKVQTSQEQAEIIKMNIIKEF